MGRGGTSAEEGRERSAQASAQPLGIGGRGFESRSPLPARPRRLQRSRAKGWRSPPGAVYVGRPSRYGNPFHVDRDLSAERAVRLFRDLVLAEWTRFEPLLAELRGKDLLCWCSLDAPCHADVLLELANR